MNGGLVPLEVMGRELGVGQNLINGTSTDYPLDLFHSQSSPLHLDNELDAPAWCPAPAACRVLVGAKQAPGRRSPRLARSRSESRC